MMGPGKCTSFQIWLFLLPGIYDEFLGRMFCGPLLPHLSFFDKNQGQKETSLQTFPCYSWKRNKKHHGLSSHRILRNLRIQLPPGISRAVIRHPLFPRKTKRSWPPCWLRIPPRSGRGSRHTWRMIPVRFQWFSSSMVTLPETNIFAPNLKIDPLEVQRFLLETTIFRRYVSFRECSFRPLRIDRVVGPLPNSHFHGL